jgi:hypothetical protein
VPKCSGTSYLLPTDAFHTTLLDCTPCYCTGAAVGQSTTGSHSQQAAAAAAAARQAAVSGQSSGPAGPCHIEPHSEYGGDVVGWGDKNIKVRNSSGISDKTCGSRVAAAPASTPAPSHCSNAGSVVSCSSHVAQCWWVPGVGHSWHRLPSCHPLCSWRPRVIPSTHPTLLQLRDILVCLVDAHRPAQRTAVPPANKHRAATCGCSVQARRAAQTASMGSAGSSGRLT